MAPDHPSSIPILLLKTKSTPVDTYEELFSSAETPNGKDHDATFSPQFVPVLQHNFQESGVAKIRTHLQNKDISPLAGSAYGGLIFTSQRAVDAFAKIVDDGKGDSLWPYLQDIPIYSVGPATTRALNAIPQSPSPLQIFGEHTGNGEVLSRYILDHYHDWYPDRSPKPPLLFLVGEQRRDIIPKTLMDPNLPADRRIDVDEVVVYGTGVMESFPADFSRVLADTAGAPERWVVVFSPTGCDGMLHGMGLLDTQTGRVSVPSPRDGKTYVATIGPTTQKHLQTNFDFPSDVCAEAPSPQGVLQGILDFRKTRSS